jgi:hypothetical protein
MIKDDVQDADKTIVYEQNSMFLCPSRLTTMLHAPNHLMNNALFLVDFSMFLGLYDVILPALLHTL